MRWQDYEKTTDSYRLEQQQFSKDRNAWFQAFVERSEDFIPIDVNQQLESMRGRYFGENAVPIGPTALAAVAKKIAELDGVQFDEEELRAAIDAKSIERILDLLLELPVPAEAKAEFTIKLLTGAGVIDPEVAVKLADGSDSTMGEVIAAKILELALEREEQGRRMADTFPAPGGNPPSGSEDDDDGDE